MLSQKLSQAEETHDQALAELKAAAKIAPCPMPLTRAPISAIARPLIAGQLVRPERPDMQDTDLTSIWALVGAGSAVRVVDVATAFPDLAVKESDAQKTDQVPGRWWQVGP